MAAGGLARHARADVAGRSPDDDAPTLRLTLDTHPLTLAMPTWSSSTPRLDRAMVMLRHARVALAAALQELEERHPDDAALQRQIVVWRTIGGVRFPA